MILSGSLHPFPQQLVSGIQSLYLRRLFDSELISKHYPTGSAIVYDDPEKI